MKRIVCFIQLIVLLGSGNLVSAQLRSASVQTICNGSDKIPSQWSLLGPMKMPLHEIGKITAVAALPDEPEIVYAGGSYGGGIFRTTNATDTTDPVWECITDRQRFKTGQVTDIIIDPSLNENSFHNLYFSCELGVFKSTDNGVTWIHSLVLTNSFDDRKMLLNPNNHSILYVIGETNEIYKTVDGGISWQSLQLSDFLIHQNPAITNEKIWNIILNPLNPEVLYASGQSAHLFRFDPSLRDPAAKQWVDVTSALTTNPDSANAKEWFRLATAGTNIYTLCRNKSGSPQIYISSDGGHSWRAHQKSNMVGARFVVSPTQQNVMYIGDNPGGRRVNKSVDGGKTFFSVTNYLPSDLYHGISTHADIRAIKLIGPTAAPPNGNGDKDFLILGDDGGVMYSHSATMNGATPVVNWKDLNGTGLCVTEFHGIGGNEKDPEYIFGGSQDDDIFRYDHGRWLTNVACDAYECVIDPFNPSVVYGQKDCGGGTRLFQSTDSGLTWRSPFTTIYESGGGRKPMIVNKANNHFYMAYFNLYESLSPTNPDYQLVLNKPECKKSNFAAAPFNIPGSWTVGAFDVCETNPQIIYYGFAGPSLGDANSLSKKLFKTTDDGATWIDITGADKKHELSGVRSSSITAIAMNPDHPDEVYVCFDGTQETSPGNGVGVNRVMKSTDGGQTWIDYSQGLREFNIYSLKFQRDANFLYAATWIGVYVRKTDDPDSRWECFNKDLPATAVTDLEINYCAQKIRAATYGRGLWESALATGSTKISGTQAWSTPHQLVTDLIIASGARLVINTEVSIAKGRKIIVEAGGILIIAAKAHLYNDCNEKWDGFIVDVPKAELQIHKNAVVEDKKK
jgi:hypothetical protein